jgi:peroxiredoxin Q/BCP
MANLKAGDKAPAFKLMDQSGKTVKLSDFGGKKVLLYFYPKADTPGCTKQACSVRDAEPDLEVDGVTAIGISPDKPEKQKKFDEKYALGFPLLSDEDHSVAKVYGAWGTKKMYGKSYEGIVRSSSLINEKGIILHAWYKVSPADTAPNVSKALRASPK